KKPSKKMKTWIYKADNVRDFAWTASRKFVWDAMPHITEAGKRVMCMSYYGKEAYPIYNRYSTKAVAHTLYTYSKYSIPYPYPVAISVEAANGMEYPMICFNYGRAEEDGTYTERAKRGAISVIIHEVGHNYFPMIINSDERQWTWMDEGLNSFVQYLSEQEFDNNYPSRRGPAYKVTNYMSMHPDRLEPIMTNSENIVQFGNNAYHKPAVALNVLRETIMGRELFDYAFREYCRRWAFKHPTPADFFRTMEDASGVDLDWFWRGWFYGIEPVDIALDSIAYYRVDMENNPEKRDYSYPVTRSKPYDDISKKRNREEGMKFAVDQDESLRDFYTTYKPWETEDSIQEYTVQLYEETFTQKEKEKMYGDNHYYELYFKNKGGLVMPVILEWTFEDGSTEVERIPAEIWRKNETEFKKVFVKKQKVTAVKLDPFRETGDIDESNNNWPVKEVPSRFQVFKQHKMKEVPNPMQKAKKQGKDIKP
ncbi:MAG: M1 family peptidase, partial [Saprospiraceae bacterium]|nr:M1 family peptidase [Saprospiraceae bacterium]